MRFRLLPFVVCVCGVVLPGRSFADGKAALAKRLEGLETAVMSEVDRERYERMVSRDIERRRLEAIQRENEAWYDVEDVAGWESFRDPRIRALKESLGTFPPRPKKVGLHVGRTIAGDGYVIRNVVFQSRPGVYVTANLYTPAKPGESMPGILFSHAHHTPKGHSELQEMGMTWARQGWVVLVPDMLGHGERATHDFESADDYEGSFRVSRQDYYFRYDNGQQLHLIGESLLGWFVQDLMRCVDVLLAQPGVDPERIVMIGAVAGGGDPAGCVAALDERIDAVAPFNFGGPQPDYAIPDDEENEFYYFGVPYWEMTRALRLGGRDGFAQWVIVTSVAPRRLIYSCEFSLDRYAHRDPAWKRMQRVFALYDERDRLGRAQGRGILKGRPPKNTHCTHVGRIHRRQLYPHFERWFDMTPPADDYEKRYSSEELACWTPELKGKLRPRPLHAVVDGLAAERVAAAREKLAKLAPAARRKKLQEDWARILGDVEPGEAKVLSRAAVEASGVAGERVLLEVEPGIVVPLVLLRPAGSGGKATPVVVAFAQAGKQALLEARRAEFAELLEKGVAVCLPDLRNTGETSQGGNFGPSSAGTNLSCRDQIFGQTQAGAKLRDLRCVLKWLRERDDVDAGSMAVWGDSLAAVNPPERRVDVPRRIGDPPRQSQPLAGLLALWAGLYEDDLAAVAARGTFATQRSMLQSAYTHFPHDAVVPGALEIGDVSDVVAAIAPRGVWLGDFVDGHNRRVATETARSALEGAETAHAKSTGLVIDGDDGPSAHLVRWLGR